MRSVDLGLSAHERIGVEGKLEYVFRKRLIPEMKAVSLPSRLATVPYEATL